ncbi:MAG: hypothetical protein ABJC13_02665 [Acidobacteriota bacterium]
MIPARVKVRLQARGGKILGPATEQPLLTVKDLIRRETLITDEKFNKEASGTVVPASPFKENFSRNALVVEPPAIPAYPTPGPYWLEPPVGEGELIVKLNLTEPSLLEFTASAFSPDRVFASATMWVLPEMQLLDDPGLVLTIAGLYTTVTASAMGSKVTINAHVEMMCGCPITAPPPPPETELFWPSSEFKVTAEIRPRDGRDNLPVDLTCTATSTFTGSADLQRGTFDVWLVAVQAKETNVGFAKTTVTVT